MVEEFNAIFLSWKSIVFGKIKIEDVMRNGISTRNVYYKKWGLRMGMFPHKYRLVIQNFNDMLNNYSELKIGDVFDGMSDDSLIRVYYFDFFSLEPYMAKLPIDQMIQSDNNRLAADYYSNKQFDQENLVISGSMDDYMKKRIKDDVEFVNGITFKPMSKPANAGGKKK